jgi:drug/metabolite transporter (DMT)-like permease
VDWKVVALFTPLLFVTFQAISKLLPKGTSIFLINAYASLVGVVVMLLLHFLLSDKKSPILEVKYIPMALAIGALISLGNFGIIKAYSLGAPQSLFTIMFYVALILYGIVVGLIIWHEHLNLIQVGGILLSVVGVFLVVYFRQ